MTKAPKRAPDERSEAVKYVVLIYNNPGAFEAMSEEDRNVLSTEADAFFKEFGESGEFVGGSALADPSNSKTVRVRDGVPAVTDGPFAETREQLGGFYVVVALPAFDFIVAPPAYEVVITVHTL
jgi:hypothetical protein